MNQPPELETHPDLDATPGESQRRPGDGETESRSGVISPAPPTQPRQQVGRVGGTRDGQATGQDQPGLSDEDQAVRAWAREQVRKLPRMSDDQWFRINAALGYRVRTRKR